MAVTIAEKLEAAKMHVVKAQQALMAVSTTTPGTLDLLYAVGYLIDAVETIESERCRLSEVEPSWSYANDGMRS